MAEVATGVLHNVGNVLNSVNLCATIVAEKIGELRVDNLTAAVDILASRDDLGSFVRDDPKGQRMLPYLAKLGSKLKDDRAVALTELKGLQDHIEHIKAIVATQQKYAKVSGVMEHLSLRELVEDALRVVRADFENNRIQVERRMENLPEVSADRHKILQILLNLLRNAKDAITEAANDKRIVQVALRSAGGDRVRIEIADCGVGIASENLTRIFSNGYTTKPEGHGFGLHSGALAAKQMNGALWAESDGPGLGAKFVLELPVIAVEQRSAA
jgi:C4-dicarboxylate-specific signal transduction histidine kinase